MAKALGGVARDENGPGSGFFGVGREGAKREAVIPELEAVVLLNEGGSGQCECGKLMSAFERSI